MRYFFVKIESPEAKTIEFTPQDEEQSIKEVKIFFDTLDDNVSKKSNEMLGRIKIRGNIDDYTAPILNEIFQWTRDFKNISTYRKVTIRINADNDPNSKTGLRNYVFNEVFVRDFVEQYGGEGSTDEGQFTLHLTQKANNLDKVETF